MWNIHSIIFSFKTKSAIKYQAFCRTCLNSEGLSVRFAGGGFSLEEGLTHDWLVLHWLWIGRLYHNLLLNLDLGCLKFRHAYYIHYSCKFDVFYWTFYPVSSHTWLNNWFEEIAGLLRISFKWLDEECITMSKTQIWERIKWSMTLLTQNWVPSIHKPFYTRLTSYCKGGS